LICSCTELGYILKLKKVGTAPKPDREIEDIGNAGNTQTSYFSTSFFLHFLFGLFFSEEQNMENMLVV
jgi:hypothetical protein